MSLAEITDPAELLAAVVAERWPDPATIRRELPDTPAQRAVRVRELCRAMAGYGRRGGVPGPARRHLDEEQRRAVAADLRRGGHS